MIEKRFIGIGIGASRVKLVSVLPDVKEPQVMLKDHYGNPAGVLKELLERVDPDGVAGLAVTARGGVMPVTGKKLSESEAIEECLRLLNIKADVVVSLGGESFVIYPIAPDGTVLDCISGNRCAAGTVEFFKQQLGRMNMSLAEAAYAAETGKVVPLAKRCSVHCKSDCTHLLNKRKCTSSDIVRTLCYNMAEKVAGLVKTMGINKGTIVVIGGASANSVIIEDIQKLLSQFIVIVPREAEYFETLGAASIARKKSLPIPSRWSDILRDNGSSFGFWAPLENYEGQVTFLSGRRGSIRTDRKYILGIDGGSTTTKVALVDMENLEICGSHYTKTDGDPEQAMKKCLKHLRDQIVQAVGNEEVTIVGVGSTGSSGEILSVLCQTPWYHNEIIAHAFGASHFCPQVDTIFEIGGQDSKFTSLRSKVAIDFNMNESCSAGTGSFLEETAQADLGIPMERIADLALLSRKPLRFSDQCAAFANSDTRKAFQEGASKEDNLAGLVYAIVENYLNKVVGQRKIGNHILFQGGTSKNRAIACAFAARTRKHITVPPDSELMGCFGIALWLREKIVSGDAPEKRYSLNQILETSVSATEEFVCKACENICVIQNLIINGRKYPFGGQCLRWENARQSKKTKTDDLNLVAKRNRMLFHEYGVAPYTGQNGEKPGIGLLGAFSVHALYPLYSWFFHELGYAVKLSEIIDPAGVQKCQSARCYPYEIAHGTFYDLVRGGVKNIFAPHIVGMPRDRDCPKSVSCPIAQAAPYYLSAAFHETGVNIYGPVIDMKNGLESVENVFADLALSLGRSRRDACKAFRKGCEMQKAFWQASRHEGMKALRRLEHENAFGIVLVGRPYNAFSRTANMGVPGKFASSGITIIPCDFLPCEGEFCEKTMYWEYGQLILRAIRFVKKHSCLFPVYISNFGCGPDSFIQHYTDGIMKTKPYLYLELDSHTADAGIATRVAAFLDIISGYRKLCERKDAPRGFVPAELVTVNSQPCIRTSKGELIGMTDARVTLAFPSMGRFNTEAMAAVSRRFGFHALALPPANDEIVSIGKEFTSGKECSPAILTVGSLMSYCRKQFKKEKKDEVLLFFMPTANGPCRFGQYNVYMKKLIELLAIEDVAFYSPTAEDGYHGLGPSFVMSAWLSVVISSVMNDIRAVLKVAAENRKEALCVFENEWQRLINGFEHGYFATWKALNTASSNLAKIKIQGHPADIPKVLLTGEIFVRCDDFSCRAIDDYYADEGMMLKTADVTEWIYFTNWSYLNVLAAHNGFPSHFLGSAFFLKQLKKAFLNRNSNSRAFVKTRLKLAIQQWEERIVRRILGKSNLLVTKQHLIDHVVRSGARFINPALTGEAILTAGLAVEVMERSPLENYCGVIVIGPFNCMPTGIAESVIKPYARRKSIPYLTIETDGGPMPSNFQSQMEVHAQRVKRFASAKAAAPLNRLFCLRPERRDMSQAAKSRIT